MPLTVTGRLAQVFEDVKPHLAVYNIYQPAIIHVHIVGLRVGLAGDGLGDEEADLLRLRRIGDVHDAKPAGEPRQAHPSVRHTLLKLMGAEPAPGPAPRRIEFAHLKGGDRPDVRQFSYVEDPQAGVRPAAMVLVFLVHDEGDLPAADRKRDAQRGMRRLGEGRMVVVASDTVRPADVRDVEDVEPRVPERRPELVLVPESVVKPVTSAHTMVTRRRSLSISFPASRMRWARSRGM